MSDARPEEPRRLVEGAFVCLLAILGTSAALAILKATGRADDELTFVDGRAYAAVVVVGVVALAAGLLMMQWTRSGRKGALVQGSAMLALQLVLALALVFHVGVSGGGGQGTISSYEEQEIRSWDVDVTVAAPLTATLSPPHDWPTIQMPADEDAILVTLDWNLTRGGPDRLDLRLEGRINGSWGNGYGDNGMGPGANFTGRVELAGLETRITLDSRNFTLVDQVVHVQVVAYRQMLVTCVYAGGLQPPLGPGTCESKPTHPA
jgi:hypothetical protein